MSNANVGKHGFPVLAYLTPQPLSLPFSLRVQHHEARKQVTLMLRTLAAAYMHRADDDMAFVAQYDGHNLFGAAEDAATVYIPQARAQQVVRNRSNPNMMTLTLKLKQPCPLWCPRVDAMLPAPAPSAVDMFKELVQFAKATTVHIVFDRRWLAPEQAPILRSLVDGDSFTGFPVSEYYSRFYRSQDWTVFGPLGADPPYKRPRRASSTPSSPPAYKRKNPGEAPPPLEAQSQPQSHLLSHSEPPAAAASPTEAASSPLPLKSPNPHFASEDEHDFQTRAISRVVQRHLPTIVAPLLPDTVTKLLPAHLASHLPALFALPASFDSSLPDSDLLSSPPSDPPPPPALPLHDLTPLGASLLPHLIAHLRPQLQKMHNAVLARDVRYRTDAAVLEIEESADDKLTELIRISEDGAGELQRQAGYVLDDARERVMELGEDVSEEMAEEIEDRVREKGELVFEHVVRRLEARVGMHVVKHMDGCTCTCMSTHAGDAQSTPAYRARARAIWRRRGKGGYLGLADRWKTVA